MKQLLSVGHLSSFSGVRLMLRLYYCTDLICQWNPNWHNITFNKDIKRYLKPSVWSWSLVELKLDRSLVVFGEEGSAKRTIVWRTIGPNSKISPRIKFKKIREIDWVNLCLQQFDRFLIMKLTWLETEIVLLCLKLAWKNSWNHLKRTYFWWVSVIWNHCAYLRARNGTHSAHLVHVSAGDGQLAADDAITTSVLVHFKKVTIYSV